MRPTFSRKSKDTTGSSGSGRPAGNTEPIFSVERGAVEEYVRRLHPDRMHLKVAEIIEETPRQRPSVSSLRRTPAAVPGGPVLCVYCDIGSVRTGRPYSLSSPPSHRGYYDITVKAVEDGSSRTTC